MPDRAPARALMLDIGGVVLESGPVLIRRLARHAPGLRDLIESIGGIGDAHDELWQQMLTGAVTERAYWAQRSGEIGRVLGPDHHRRYQGQNQSHGDSQVWGFRELMQLLFAGASENWLRTPVLDLMDDVRSAGIPLGALTNDLADFHGQDWVDAQPWVRHFDVIVDASHTGVLKPDPRAFAAGAQALALPPHEIVYLDDMPWNIEAGLTAGLLAVQVSHDDPMPAVHRARQLLGLVPVPA
jgi:putative hydrolase of the HAD superfamily